MLHELEKLSNIFWMFQKFQKHFKNIILELFFFNTKYSLIFGDKKIQNQKWCIVEKFQPQKLGVTKDFFIFKVVSDFDFNHFLEK